MFRNVQTFNTLLWIYDISGAKRSFCFADVILLTWCIGMGILSLTLHRRIGYKRLKLGNRKFLLQCFCVFVEDFDAVVANLRICLWRSHADVKSTLNRFFLLTEINISEFLHWHKINILLFLKWKQASLRFHADINSTFYSFSGEINLSELGHWCETIKLWSSYWPLDFWMCLSCIKPLNGAKPVPGPTMMTGVTDLKGRRNWVLRTKIGMRVTSPSAKTKVTKI